MYSKEEIERMATEDTMKFYLGENSDKQLTFGGQLAFNYGMCKFLEVKLK